MPCIDIAREGGGSCRAVLPRNVGSAGASPSLRTGNFEVSVRPWVLAELNYGYVREHPCQVAVLPLGATEPHNLHLPYGTDIFEAETIAGRACEAAFHRGAAVVMLPPIPYGTDTNQLGFPLAINLT